MDMYNQIYKAIVAYREAIKLLPKLGLIKYVILLIVLLFFFIAPVFFMDFGMTFFSSLIPFFETSKYVEIVTKLMVNASGFFLLVLLSPIFSMVSEETIAYLKVKTYSFSIKQLFKDIVRGIRITFRNMIYQYAFILLVSFILWMFPDFILLQKMGELVLLITTAYFYGFTLLDYALENYRFDYKKSVAFIRENKGLAIGLGIVYYVVLMLPKWLLVWNVFKHISIYWTSFIEAIVVFLGVIAASISVFKLIKK